MANGDTFEQGDYTYTISGSTVSVKATDTTKSAYGDIPDTVTSEGAQYTVTSMSGCFRDCARMTYAPPIPTGVTTLQTAFYGCTSLATPPTFKGGNVANINSAFYGCASLTEPPDLSRQVKMYGMSNTFNGCASLAKPPAMPNALISAGGSRSASYMFYGCESLLVGPDLSCLDSEGADVNIAGAFRGCSSMETPPTLPQSLNSHGGTNGLSFAFYGCSSLERAPELPDDAVGSAQYCFAKCASLTEPPAMPSGITDMQHCFSECGNLVAAPHIPNSVTDMKWCFYNCTSLASVDNIPTATTDFTSCFRWCASLESVPNTFAGAEEMEYCFLGCKSLTSAPDVPSSVESLECCFSGCSSLVSPPSIAYGVEDLFKCFNGCSSLAEPPTIPQSVTNMTLCFNGCSSLAEPPDIPSQVTFMDECFRRCTALASAPEVPSSVTLMTYCFEDCKSLTGAVVVNPASTNASHVFDGTAKPIFIVPDGAADADFWRGVADDYENVFFFADANSKPVLALSAKRVAADQDSVEDTGGTWVYATATATAYKDRLPEGYGNSIVSLAITANGTAEHPTWTVASTEEDTLKVTKVYRGWFEATTAKQALAMTATDEYGATSPSITFTLPSTAMLLDFLDGDTGTGVAFGKMATRDGLDCALPAYFDDVSLSGSVQTAVKLRASALDREDFDTTKYPLVRYEVRDANGLIVGQLDAIQDAANNRTGARLLGFGKNGVYNILGVYVGTDGSRSYGVSDKPAFRSAIGLGDTELTTSNASNAVITPASGVTISSVAYATWGKVAMLTVVASGLANSTGSLAVGTVADGKRPVMVARGQIASTRARYVNLTTAGALTAYYDTAPLAGSSVSMTLVYLLP